MSKRKHKSRNDNRREANTDNRNNVNNMNNRQQQFNNPFGINPNQLLSMFGNIDMNQINSMLQSMNTQGFDFNNLNLGNLGNLMGNMNSGNQRNNPVGETNQNNKDDMEEDVLGNNINREDGNIQMLRAIRSIVDGERASFIDKVIESYNKGNFDD